MKLKTKSKQDFEKEVSTGCFLPNLAYNVVYTSPEERRLQPALMNMELKRANENLRLSVDIMEEACTRMFHVCVWGGGGGFIDGKRCRELKSIGTE